MIYAEDFLNLCKMQGFEFFFGTPCSYLKPLINAAIDDPSLNYYAAPNEGDAVAMACGAFVAGKKGIVMFQNSGLGNAINPLTSLNYPFKIPLILIITHRGCIDEPPDEPQHEQMGMITQELLNILNIPYENFPSNKEDLPDVFNRALQYINLKSLPYAFLMRKDALKNRELMNKKKEYFLEKKNFPIHDKLNITYYNRIKCKDVLETVLKHKRLDDVIISTTGYISRELYSLEDAPNHFYMVGSMGCASSFGLGVSIIRKDFRVIVLDGDGAALMRMGNIALAGILECNNFMHIILDNEAYASTGCQPTGSENISFASVAMACGYDNAYITDSIKDLEYLLNNKSLTGPTLIHFKIQNGTLSNLKRPKIKPFEVKERLIKYLKADSSQDL